MKRAARNRAQRWDRAVGLEIGDAAAGISVGPDADALHHRPPTGDLVDEHQAKDLGLGYGLSTFGLLWPPNFGAAQAGVDLRLDLVTMTASV